MFHMSIVVNTLHAAVQHMVIYTIMEPWGKVNISLLHRTKSAEI